MKYLNKKKKIYTLLIAILTITVGYALIATELKIRGTINIDKNTWDIHFENLDINTNSVTAETAPICDDETTKELEYAITLNKPGDFYEFTVDVVNNGSIDAMITGFKNKLYDSTGTTEVTTQPAYLSNTITYEDDIPVAENHLLKKRVDQNTPTREKVKVRVEFKKNIEISDLPSTQAESYIYKIQLTYKQADNTAEPVRVDFSQSSWNSIISAYNAGTTKQLKEAMEAGTTREVKLDLDHDGTSETTKHVRIANLTPCSEVSVTSKSSCGLIIEFTDIITTHRMNKYENTGSSYGDGNKGGWEKTDMRAYLNSLKYLEEDNANFIDYTDIGLIDALPSDLKNSIIDTTVITGAGSQDGFSTTTTTDKLYLLSLKEIYNYVNSNLYSETTNEITRQLDYYEKKNTTGSSTSAVIKKNGETNANWWLRSIPKNSSVNIIYVKDDGKSQLAFSNNEFGVSPAFRLSN